MHQATKVRRVGAARSRNVRGEARRSEMLSAGMRLLSEHGVGRVTVSDITKAVGVSKTLFYWYFRDVDHLVRDALVQGVDVIRAALASGLVGIDDPLERLERRLRTGLELVE